MEEQTQSVEDRIGDLIFGPEPSEEPEQEEAQEAVEAAESDEVEEVEAEEVEAKDDDEPELIEVEYEGKLYEVTPEIRDALLRQSDYTQKTQEVAAQRKAVEVEQARIQQQAQQYEFVSSVEEEISQIRQIDAAIPQWQQHLRENVDNLSHTEIEKIRLTIDELKQHREAIGKSLESKYGEFQQAREQAQRELLEKSTEVLRSKYPDWNGEAVTEYAKSLGFTEDAIAIAQTDPRQMELVRKAMLYDQLQEGKTAAVAKVKAAPKIKAKSRNPMPKEVGDKLNLRKKLKSDRLSNAQKANLIGESVASKFF